MKPLHELIAVARGLKRADLVLKNAHVFNVFTGKFNVGDVAVTCGYIAGIGEYSGQEELDLSGKYLTPGFIDGHVHIESSMVSPSEFARMVIPAGTTTVIADPHEIANVVGLDGLRYILEASEGLPVNVYVMLPSCVPTSILETSGAKLTAKELARFIGHPRVLGLGELMDYPGVLRQDEGVFAKIRLAEGKQIDGHAPGLTGKELTAYINASIGSDHECVTPGEALEKLEQGIYIMLREGSAAKNLLDLLPIIDRFTARRCLFATDDRHPADLINLGHINHMVKMAVEAGIDLPTVLQMATINAATYFRLNDLGAIAPGYRSDLLVFEDLNSWRPAMVFKDGRIAAQNGKALFDGRFIGDSVVRNTVRLGIIDPAKLKIPAYSATARVIGLVPHQIVTIALELAVPVVDGEFKANPAQDILKLAVFERHCGTGNVGVGLVSGLGMRTGAIASTIAHDSHNLVVVGASDEDIILAAQEIERMQGGICIVNNGRVLGSLPLPLAGLMSENDIYALQTELALLQNMARELGIKLEYDPFMTLAFLSLPVIPALKLTDKGLVDVDKFALVPVSV